MSIRRVEAMLIDVDGRTDMTRVVDTSCGYADVSESEAFFVVLPDRYFFMFLQ
jgi:hypothetical protein